MPSCSVSSPRRLLRLCASVVSHFSGGSKEPSVIQVPYSKPTGIFCIGHWLCQPSKLALAGTSYKVFNRLFLLIAVKGRTCPIPHGKTAVTISKIQNPLPVNDNVSEWERKIKTWQTIPVRTHKDQVGYWEHKNAKSSHTVLLLAQQARQTKNRVREDWKLLLTVPVRASQVTFIHHGWGCPSLSRTCSWQVPLLPTWSAYSSFVSGYTRQAH